MTMMSLRYGLSRRCALFATHVQVTFAHVPELNDVLCPSSC